MSMSHQSKNNFNLLVFIPLYVNTNILTYFFFILAVECEQSSPEVAMDMSVENILGTNTVIIKN